MNVDRTERNRLREPHELDDDPIARKGEPRRTEAQLGAARLEQLIAESEHGAGPHMIPWESTPTCGYAMNSQVAACRTESVPGAQLFVKGAGDVDVVDANDIGQHAIGDCHLLGPTVALLKSPEGRKRIGEMFKEVQRDGKTVYEVAFHVPVDRTTKEWLKGAPTFKHVQVEVPAEFIEGHVGVGDVAGDKQEVWPLVLEAAYAKLRGGYPMIHGGQPNLAFEAITGKKAETRILDAGMLSYTSNNLKKDFEAGKPICVSFTGQAAIGARTAPAMGHYQCIDAHCYMLGAIYEKGGVTYVQLKNPWGRCDPTPIPLRELEEMMPRVDVGQLP